LSASKLSAHELSGKGKAVMSKVSTAERDEAIRTLKQDIKLKPGETVWTVLRHVSASGMSRTIDIFVIRDKKPRRISHLVARAVGYGFDRDRMGIKSQGGGMDMGFEAVYNLGYALLAERREERLFEAGNRRRLCT
jgi:hypothetical protein